jgi:hypothetical protein
MATRGRPKGARSVVGIKLADLNRFLKDEAIVPIEVKFAKALFTQNKVDFTVMAEELIEGDVAPIEFSVKEL